MTQRMYRMRLLEASKARFINQVWDILEDDQDAVMNMTNYKTSFLPDAQTIIKWVDSGAADSFLQKSKFNWQNFVAGKNDENGDPLYVPLLNAYFDYKEAGGSRKEKHEYIKKNPYEIFKQSGLKTIESGEQDADADMMLLPELENKEFIFVVPLTWEACKFMDSFECGGAGAKWCLGYEKTDSYFRDYVKKGYLFVLALRKKQTTVKDEIKYMIEIFRHGRSEAWRQDDKGARTIPEHQYREMFGWEVDTLFSVFKSAILSWKGNVYTTAEEENYYKPDQGFDIDGIDHGEYEYEDYTMSICDYKEFILNGGGSHRDELDLSSYIDSVNQCCNMYQARDSIKAQLMFKVRNGDFEHVDFTTKEGWIPQNIIFEDDVYVERLDLSSYVYEKSCILGNCFRHVYVDGKEIDWP